MNFSFQNQFENGENDITENRMPETLQKCTCKIHCKILQKINCKIKIFELFAAAHYDGQLLF